MEFRVICISRTLAAGGESVARTIAQRLGFQYVDEQIIMRAAAAAQVDAAVVAATEHHQPLLRRLLDKLALAIEAAGAPVSVLGTGAPLDAAPVDYSAVPEEIRALIRSAIHDVARTGQVVIVAHAASLTLAGMEGVLRVLVTASPETRAQRHADEQGMTLAAAADVITASDRERREYFRTFYGVADESPTHYDLVINTDGLTPAQAGTLILAVVEPPSAAP